MLGPTSLPALQEAGERGPLAGCVQSRAMRSAAQTAATGRFPTSPSTDEGGIAHKGG